MEKDIYCCDVKTKKERRQSSITKNELFRSSLKQAVSNGIKFEYALGDTWFGAKDNMEFIHYKIQKKFIFGMKANRLIALSKEDKKKHQYHKLSTLDFQDGEKKIAWLKDQAFPVAIIKKVFTNGDGSTGILYLVTNDLDIDADTVYEIYQKRWRIEEYHKSIKQNASLEKSPTKVVRSQKNHIFASIIGYCKLEMLKIKTKLNHFAIKQKLLLRANQVTLEELWKLRKLCNSA